MPVHSLAAHHTSELDQLGDEIAELSAHLDAATARLLALIREFDAPEDGTRASAPAPPGSAGGWDSIWARPVNASGWRAPSGRCRSSPKPLPAASCRTRRSAP
jgi:hypothetical protein